MGVLTQTTSTSGATPTPSGSGVALPTAQSTTSPNQVTGNFFSTGGNSFLFGFLGAFVGLLIFTLICGILVRRAGLRRHGLWGLGLTDIVDGESPDQAKLDVPKLWELNVAKADGHFVALEKDNKLESMMPVSAEIVGIKPEAPSPPKLRRETIPGFPSPPPTVNISMTQASILPLRNPEALHGLSLPTRRPAPAPVFAAVGQSYGAPAGDSEKISPDVPSRPQLQVTFIVTMPRKPDQQFHDGDEGTIDEYEFGMVNVDWDGDHNNDFS